MTDYRTLSGAAFQREVGTDPDKWAEAFLQTEAAIFGPIGGAPRSPDRDGWVAMWFRDAMEAACKNSIRAIIEEDSA